MPGAGAVDQGTSNFTSDAPTGLLSAAQGVGMYSAWSFPICSLKLSVAERMVVTTFPPQQGVVTDRCPITYLSKTVATLPGHGISTPSSPQLQLRVVCVEDNYAIPMETWSHGSENTPCPQMPPPLSDQQIISPSCLRAGSGQGDGTRVTEPKPGFCWKSLSWSACLKGGMW